MRPWAAVIISILVAIETTAIHIELNGQQLYITADSVQAAGEIAREFAASHRLAGSGCDALEENSRNRCVAALMEKAMGKRV